MVDTVDRGTQSNLRGWLSDVYWPALLSSEADSLALRLGERATVDDPLFGHTDGGAPLGARLREIATWLAEHQASFERDGFVMGSDRDVTYGVLALTRHGAPMRLPVAVVAERKPERVVSLRVYHSTGAFRDRRPARNPLLAASERTVVPPPVAAYLDARSRGDVAAIVASFEDGAMLYDSRGALHPKREGGGALQGHYAALAAPKTTLTPVSVVASARADDGRVCALEYTARAGASDAPAEAGFAVFERGDSGLLRSLRSYDDVDALGRDPG
jgi:hypothetical protein